MPILAAGDYVPYLGDIFPFKKKRIYGIIPMMYIENICLKNFRNYPGCSVKLSPNLNILKGLNAQGKTNFLESIYLCAIGKSPKTLKDKDLIKWGENEAKILLDIKKEHYGEKIEIYLTSFGKKIIKVNGVCIRKLGNLIGEMPIVFFTPDEMSVIKEGPSYRRKFMDIDMSQLSKPYFYYLCKYEKVLEERNKLLKQSKNLTDLKKNIDVWDEELSSIASEIIFYRLSFIDKIKDLARDVHSRMTDGKEILTIKYQGINLPDIKEIKSRLRREYKRSIEKDFELHYTTVGPHRDDIEIKVNDVDIRNFGSQGQQRLATLSLKIAELSLFEKEKGEKPILLLDDVLSELDNKRCKKLLLETKGYQTILTATRFSRKLRKGDSVFTVKDGNILRNKIEK